MEGEFDLIRRFCLPLAGEVIRDEIVLGTGDDCAVVQPPPGMQLAVSTDNLVSGVHFLPDQDAADVGWRALAVSLSDLAAMGAAPAFFTCALTLPHPDENWIAGFVDGLAACMRDSGIPIVGGNLARGPLNLCMTVHGWVPQGGALTRGGARPGDRLVVSGTPGEAAAGLQVLREMPDARQEHAALVGRYLRPRARLALGEALRGVASAAIDVSDGLLADAGHLAGASAVALDVEVATVPVPAAAGFAAERCRDWALAGGDDYELCFTVPESRIAALRGLAEETGLPLTVIGRVREGSGVWLVDDSGQRKQADEHGYRHF